VNGKEGKIIQKTLELLKSSNGRVLNIDLKMKCVELLAAFLYKGFINVIIQILGPKDP
jgi:hypothetical protein